MPRVCTICRHPELDEIERALVAGEPYRRIAARFAVSDAALRRHQADHLPEHLSRAQEAAETAQADDLLGQMASLHARTLKLLTTAEGAGDGPLALRAVKEVRGNIELLAKLTNLLSDRPTVNVLIAPEWLVLRTALLDALRPYPEARAAVAGRLVALEAGAATDGGMR